MYLRKCDFSGSTIVSVYSPDKPYTIYKNDIWISDEWDPLSFGRDYNREQTFTEQFKLLQEGVLRLALSNIQSENSDYCNSCMGNKNCYLVFGGDYNDNVLFSTLGMRNKDPLDIDFSDASKQASSIYKQLWQFGGFPEPFLKKSPQALRRWHNERLDRMIKEDIRDIESIRDLSALQILGDTLLSRVGSLLSLNSLRGDLNVAHKTISLWMDILERFYYHYRIYPFSNNSIKSLRKGPKIYLWDWSQVENESARLENMIASHLLKFYDKVFSVFGKKIFDSAADTVPGLPDAAKNDFSE